MKDDTKNQLSEILGKYDAKLAEVERLDAENRAAQATFPARFAALMKETVRPTFEEFASVLNSRGHEVVVREHEEPSSIKGAVTFTTISLHVVPRAFVNKSVDVSKSFIEVSFSAKRNERKVGVSSSNTVMNSGASLGKRGEYDIEAVTPDVVAGHVLYALREGLAGA